MRDKNGSKKQFVKESNQILSEDGEVLVSKMQSTGMIEIEPPYVKLYLNDIARLNGLNQSEQKLVNELVANMGYNNIVPNYKAVKDMIAERIGMTYHTLDKAIKTLYSKGILIRKARGMYIMDPNIFGRGSWKDVKKIRMVVDYNPDGTKTINTEVSKQLNLFE